MTKRGYSKRVVRMREIAAILAPFYRDALKKTKFDSKPKTSNAYCLTLELCGLLLNEEETKLHDKDLSEVRQTEEAPEKPSDVHTMQQVL